MNSLEKMHIPKGKLCKSDYQRFKNESRRINGVDKNKEGQAMAKAIFIEENNTLPTKQETKDFYSKITHGHSISITQIFESKFGQVNPFVAINSLEAQLNTQTSSLSSVNISGTDISEFHTSNSSSLEYTLTINPNDYTINLN